MDPVSAVSAVKAGWEVAKIGGEVTKKLFDLIKNTKDHEIKQQLSEIVDQINDLKRSASELEDENRDLREKLRFKSDEYDFRNPFYYHKSKPDEALCPKCHAIQRDSPMGLHGQGCTPGYRQCLVCDRSVPERSWLLNTRG